MVKSLDYVSLLGSGMFVVVVHPSVPVKTLKEFVAYAKSRKEPVLFGTPGIGQRLVMEQLKSASITSRRRTWPTRAVRRRSAISWPATSRWACWASRHRSRTLKTESLAGAGGDRVHSAPPQLPDVPTVAELGYAGIRDPPSGRSFGLPPGTPPAIVARLHDRADRGDELAPTRSRSSHRSAWTTAPARRRLPSRNGLGSRTTAGRCSSRRPAFDPSSTHGSQGVDREHPLHHLRPAARRLLRLRWGAR